MKIDKQTVNKIANLARIAIKDNEVDTYTQEMNKILTFMEKLNELDTAGVEPLVYLNQQVNVWRSDEVKQQISVTDGLKNAAIHHNAFFLVPKIIEK